MDERFFGSLIIKFGDGDFLKDHVSDGRFIENAEMVFVDHDEGGISPAFGVEEDLGGPCFAVVGGAADRHV